VSYICYTSNIRFLVLKQTRYDILVGTTQTEQIELKQHDVTRNPNLTKSSTTPIDCAVNQFSIVITIQLQSTLHNIRMPFRLGAALAGNSHIYRCVSSGITGDVIEKHPRDDINNRFSIFVIDTADS